MALKMFGRPEIGSLWVNQYSGMAIVIGYKTDGFNDDVGIVRYRYLNWWWRESDMYDYNFMMYFKPVTKDENR